MKKPKKPDLRLGRQADRLSDSCETLGELLLERGRTVEGVACKKAAAVIYEARMAVKRGAEK